MLIDSYILPECLARPGSFGGLMVLYEANFIKLNQLVKGLHSFSGESVSRCADDCDLYLSVENRTKYSCQIRLTYLFDDMTGGTLADPDLLAKVYFDARIVEVKSWIDASRHELLYNLNRHYRTNLNICWVRNIMLGKWLDYVIDRGHRFSYKSL